MFNFRRRKAASFPDEEILNYGLKLAMEFGKNWLQPIQTRLSKKHPELTMEQLDAYNDICQKAMKCGHDCVYSMESGLTDKQMLERLDAHLSVDFGWVSRKNRSKLFSQGMYYRWKDLG